MKLEFDLEDILIDNAKFQIDWLKNKAPKQGMSIEGYQDIADTLEGFINYINETRKSDRTGMNDVARVQEDGSVEWRPDLPDLPVGTKLYTHPAFSLRKE